MSKLSRVVGLTILITIGFALGGCSSKRAASRTSDTFGKHERITPSTDKQVNELVREARRWIGTPYSYGGHTRGRGADCSGFVMEIFKYVYDIKLPRSSAMQQEYASPIRFDDMKPGDLVFFSTSKSSARVSHVGLYIGDGRMIHSSASRGVMESSLSEKYWKKNLHSQGRVIETGSNKHKKNKTERTPAVNERLQELYDALDQQIDSLYVTNPEIFD